MKISGSFLVGLMLLSTVGCVEEISFELENLENYLVVDARLTDELKNHELRLSRTYSLDQSEVDNFESNARVQVITDNGEIFEFRELNNGIYQSTEAFQALPDIAYRLRIVTDNDEIFESSPEVLIPGTTINSIEVDRREINAIDGVAINVSTTAEAGASNFYKYEYEETYKIVSRYRFGRDIKYDMVLDSLYDVPKDYEENVCFKTNSSNELIIGSTNELSENSLQNKLIHFIPVKDPRISFRYSVEITQLSLSQQQYDYYRTLQEMSINNSLFSQTQPGFLSGNIYNENGGQEAIGLFTVSSVSKNRIFFDFEDFHSPPELPTYLASECEILIPDLFDDFERDWLIDLVSNDQVKLYDIIPTGIPNVIFYAVTAPNCIDCRFYGKTETPDFWVE